MSKYLYKVGKWSALNKKKVLFSWLTVVVLMLVGGLFLKPNFSDDMKIPGTSSDKANAIITKVFPAQSDNATSTITIKAPKKETFNDNNNRNQIEEVLSGLKQRSTVLDVSDPFSQSAMNSKENILNFTVTYKTKASKLSNNELEVVKTISSKLKQHGFTVGYSGDILPFKLEIGGISEVIGIVLALVVLFVMFRSLTVAGLPILTSIVSLLLSLAITFISTKFLSIPSFSLSLMSMIGLAVGIDYSLFIYSKHKINLKKQNYPLIESIGQSVATAGEAVVFAGLTVIIALSALLVVGIPFLGIMGVMAAISVLVAVIASVTLTPALLAIIGNRIITPSKVYHSFTKKRKENQSSKRAVDMVMKHPVILSLLSVIVLVLIAIPSGKMYLGLPDSGLKSAEDPERIAYDLKAEAFGEGVNAPLAILIDSGQTSTSESLSTFNAYSKKIAVLNGVTYTSPAIPDKTGRYAIINVQPKTGAHSEKTEKIVKSLRNLTYSKNSNSKIYVTGITAMNIDISSKLNDAIPLFSILIIVFAFILLLILFQSLLLPLLAVGGFLLTIFSTLGISVLLIQDGYLKELTGIPVPGPLLAFLPVLAIGILFGLAMDYQVFLATRMREEYKLSGNGRKSISVGLTESGPVVFAAGLIMVFVFAGFIFAGDSMIKSLGIVLTFGILFDAFIVRLLLIPSLMVILGESVWYFPAKLKKIFSKSTKQN